MSENQPPQDPEKKPAPESDRPQHGWWTEKTPPIPAKLPSLQPPREPKPLPSGFWARVDYLLRNSEDVREMLRRDQNLWPLSRTFFLVSILMAMLYGGVMGATNLLQGSDLELTEKLLQIVITAAKVPVLYLLTLLIVLPPIYVSNAFVGARLQFRQTFAVLLAAVAISTTILASMATVSFFFALTSRSYHFIKLLHVLFFAYAGITGLIYLTSCVRMMAGEGGAGKRTPGLVFVVWILLYMFVGTQLAWVMRPFVGSPNEPFQVFRPRHGNFYESVAMSFQKFITQRDDPPRQ